MGKFNLNQLLNSASMADGSAAECEETNRPLLKVVSLNIRDLVPSKNNFYSVENVEELKTSIEMFGVLQNLTVKPLDNGRYEIVSGHRRHKACMELVAEGKTEFEYIPCGIQTEQDEIKERILLIMTNSTARELSDWEKMKQAEELRKSFEELKKRENLTGRIRDLVAEALNTSPTQIGRLNAIDNNLTPEFKEEFKQGKIGTSAAYEISGMSEEQQKKVYSEYRESGSVSASEIKEQKRQAEQPFESPVKRVEKLEENLISEKKQLENIQDVLNVKQTTPPATNGQSESTSIMTGTLNDFVEYPETPDDFEEGEESEGALSEQRSFADLSTAEKATAAMEFLNGKRFSLFAPGEDTQIFDFIVEVLESCANERG